MWRYFSSEHSDGLTNYARHLSGSERQKNRKQKNLNKWVLNSKLMTIKEIRSIKSNWIIVGP